jgi:hypothetical protein
MSLAYWLRIHDAPCALRPAPCTLRPAPCMQQRGSTEVAARHLQLPWVRSSRKQTIHDHPVPCKQQRALDKWHSRVRLK